LVDIKTLAFYIKRNCNISDATHWGYYSICSLLLKLRELYLIENKIKPWEKIDQKEIGEWISDRENLWKELENKDLEDIPLERNFYNPFDIEKINAELENEGLIYGAGYGLRMKPSFFLSELISKEKIGRFDVYVAGEEFSRDLSGYPAMLQDKKIYVRIDPTIQLIWGKFEELRLKSSNSALKFAFSKYGISPEEEPSEDIYRRIHMIARSEVETYIYHELGEAIEEEKVGDKIILSSLSRNKAEIFVRSVKDILSDTSENGMLKHIIENQKEGSLGFYIVFLGGLRKIIFPEISDAFHLFLGTGDWLLIEKARRVGYIKAEGYAERLLSLNKKYNSEKELMAKYVEEEILWKEFSL
jgi:hypothetical protein